MTRSSLVREGLTVGVNPQLLKPPGAGPPLVRTARLVTAHQTGTKVAGGESAGPGGQGLPPTSLRGEWTKRRGKLDTGLQGTRVWKRPLYSQPPRSAGGWAQEPEKVGGAGGGRRTGKQRPACPCPIPDARPEQTGAPGRRWGRHLGWWPPPWHDSHWEEAPADGRPPSPRGLSPLL